MLGAVFPVRRAVLCARVYLVSSAEATGAASVFRSASVPSAARESYRPDIDGLRTIAVVPVVLFHAGYGWILGGYVGVDVFFVISGYLITSILVREIEAGRFSLIAFYERRARRILPALMSVLAASLVAGWWLLLPDDFSEFAKSAGATLIFASNIWFNYATSDYFGPAAELYPLLHTWSLAVEEQFYIVFPVLLWLILRHGRRLCIAVCVGLSLLSLALAVHWLPDRKSTRLNSSHITRSRMPSSA